MKRRDLALALATAPLWTRSAHAAGEPSEGREYTRLSQPVNVAVPGKIEVIEFFGYWCPHCNDFEPKLSAWVRKLPKDVNFRRIPVGWAPMHEPYQRLFFAIEALGLGDEAHAKVFRAVHVQGLHLEVEAGLSSFTAAAGIDKAKLSDAMRSFAVGAKISNANSTFKAYRLDGVPALAVDGRYVTSPGQANGEAQALAVVDALIAKARSKG